MKLLTFSVGGKARPGVLKGDRVIDLAAAGLPAGPNGGLLEIARGGDAMLDRVRKALNDGNAKSYALAEVKVLPPIRQPSKIVAIGLNYLDHLRDNGTGANRSIRSARGDRISLGAIRNRARPV